MSTETAPADEKANELPWTSIPRFTPGTTDPSEYASKMKFLASLWPREHIALLAPRAALLCEGTAFKKVARIPAEKLKVSDESGVRLLVSTLGGLWGRTELEEKYTYFERVIYGTVQHADESNDSYLSRHDVNFEELISKGTTLDEVRAYILLRQSQLSPEDRKKVVLEQQGNLEYLKVCLAVRLLGSKFFSELQGTRSSKTKVYDVHYVEEPDIHEDGEKAFQASASILQSEEPDPELDQEFVGALAASEDADALTVQQFEEELESFFQETPSLQEALLGYVEARSRLLAKRFGR